MNKYEITPMMILREVMAVIGGQIEGEWRGTVEDGATITITVPSLDPKYRNLTMNEFAEVVIKPMLSKHKVDP